MSFKFYGPQSEPEGNLYQLNPRGSRKQFSYKKQFKNPLSLPLRKGENQFIEVP